MNLLDIQEGKFKSGIITSDEWVYLCPILNYYNIGWEYWSVMSSYQDLQLVIISEDSKDFKTAITINTPIFIISDKTIIGKLKTVNLLPILNQFYSELGFGGNMPWQEISTQVSNFSEDFCWWLEVLIGVVDGNIGKKSNVLFSVYFLHFDVIKSHSELLRRPLYLWLSLLKLKKTETLAKLALLNILKILKLEDQYGVFQSVLYRSMEANSNSNVK